MKKKELDIKQDLKKGLVPNIITSTRLILGFFSLILFFCGLKELMLGAFVTSALTDWADGFAARKLNQQTKTGAAFDVISDKILTAIGGFIAFQIGSLAFLALLLGEGITGIITFYRKYILKTKDMKPSLIGKLKEWPLKMTFGLGMLSSVVNVPTPLITSFIALTGIFQVATISGYTILMLEDKKRLKQSKLKKEETINSIDNENLRLNCPPTSEKTIQEKIDYWKFYKLELQKHTQKPIKPITFVKK